MKLHTVIVEKRKFNYKAGGSWIVVSEQLPKSQYALLKPMAFALERTSDDILGLVTAEIQKRIEKEKGSNDAK